MNQRLILAGSLCVLLSTLRAAAPSSIAIKDAHIVTVSGADLQRGTVLLKGGLIQDVGESVSIPPEAWIIDGAGLTVYPGFIDGLSTWGIPNGGPPPRASTNAQPTAPANQPRVHGPEDRPQTYSAERAADMVSPSDSRLTAVRAAGFTTAATYPNKGIFEGQGAVIDLAGERGRDMIVAQPVGQQVAFRVGAGGMGRSFPGSLMGNISYVRQLYLDLAQYKQAKEIYSAHPAGLARPEYDHDLEGLAESPRLLLPADESQQIERMLSFGQELKVPFVLYGLHEGFAKIERLKQANIPLLISLKWPEKPKDGDPSDIPNLRDLQIRDRAPAVPGMLAKAGVKFGFYSDGVDTAPDLKKAIRKAIDAGLSREDAVRALTLIPAEMYGLSDRLGSIEKGKIANLLVTRGAVFDEQSTIEYVFVDGKDFRPSREQQEGPPSGAGGARRPSVANQSEIFGGKQ
jgi:Amidohydrolase family